MARKIVAFFAVILLVGACLAGCAQEQSVPAQQMPETSSTAEKFPYTFTDSTGAVVTLEAPPQKTAVLFSSYAQIWTLAGGEVSVTVGDTIDRGFAPEGTLLVDDGAGMKIDVEQLVASKPDLVIASADMAAQAEACVQLRDLGIPSAAFREESFEDYLELLELFADLTGHPETVQTYGLEVRQRVEETLEAARESAEHQEEPVSVLFIRAGSGDSSTRAKTADNHFVGVMLQELGTRNIADEAGSLSERLSLESIVAAQPDVILIVPQGNEEAARAYMDSLLAESGWKDLQAVQEGRCHYLPKDLFHYKPNHRWDEAYQYLAGLIYPEETDA